MVNYLRLKVLDKCSESLLVFNRKSLFVMSPSKIPQKKLTIIRSRETSSFLKVMCVYSIFIESVNLHLAILPPCHIWGFFHSSKTGLRSYLWSHQDTLSDRSLAQQTNRCDNAQERQGHFLFYFPKMFSVFSRETTFHVPLFCSGCGKQRAAGSLDEGIIKPLRCASWSPTEKQHF